MAEETQEGQTEDQSAESQIEDQGAESEQYVPREEYEKIKQAQAGSDRAYQQTKQELDQVKQQMEELRKQQMSEKERAEYEQQQREQALQNKEREVQEATLRLTKLQVLGEKGLPTDLERFVVGESEEEIRESADTLVGQINKLVEERSQSGRKAAPPRAGKPKTADVNDWIRQQVNENRRRK